MTPSSDSVVGVGNLTRDIAALGLALESRRVVCDRLRSLIEPLEQARILAVAGERAALDTFEQRLARAKKVLGGIQAEAPNDDAEDRTGEVATLLSDVSWAVADQLIVTLEAKNQRHREIVRGWESEISEWRTRITLLTQEIEQARKVKAPVGREESERRLLDDLVLQADRALRESRHADVAVAVAKLADRPPVTKVIDGVREKTVQGRVFSDSADVLLLRSPEVEGRFDYTVLLRTPSLPGSHGVNIEGSRALGALDRVFLRDTIDAVTGAVNQGLSRRFSARSEVPTQGAVAERSPLEKSEAAPLASAGDAVSDNGLRQLRVPTQASTVADLPARLREVGDWMYRLLLPGAMRRFLEDYMCSLTVTTNDLELPWELMHDGQDYLCLRRPVARMPMGRAFPRASAPLPPSAKLRFLLIYSDPTGTLEAAEREIDTIRTELDANEQWKGSIEIDTLKGAAVTGRELNRRFRSGEYDVIHYAGHASFHPRDPDLSGLLLANKEVFYAQKIAGLLEGRPLVFLNACETGRAANESTAQQVESYLSEPAAGLASAFLYGGALGCIGSLWPIYDAPAARFAVEFYNRVLEGHMIGRAMQEARNEIQKQQPTEVTWAAFVLYGDPTFTLVR